MKKWMTIALLLLPCNSHAWSSHDTAWEAAYLALHVADWGQTRDISRLCSIDRYYRVREANPILGRCPTQGQVDAYMLATALTHVCVAHLLPASGRRPLQMLTIGIQLSTVHGNWSAGLQVRF